MGGRLGVAVSSAPAAHRLAVTGEGRNAGLGDAATAALDPAFAVERLSARNVQAHFSAVLAARLGARIELAGSPDRFEITATPAGGA